jgi:hypothetical protein
MKCVWPWPEQSLCVSLGARSDISDLKYPPFQLVLMPRIQSGDGAARTDAEDEEHKPFSHDLPSSRGERLRERFYMLLTHLRQVAAVRRMRGGLRLTLRRRSLAVRLNRARAVADSAMIRVIPAATAGVMGGGGCWGA